jgi:hypothetical protein
LGDTLRNEIPLFIERQALKRKDWSRLQNFRRYLLFRNIQKWENHVPFYLERSA